MILITFVQDLIQPAFPLQECYTLTHCYLFLNCLSEKSISVLYILMRPLLWIVLLSATLAPLGISHAQIHPKEAFGRKIFDSFRKNQFSEFYLRSIFALEEAEFREFLFTVNNLNLRNDLFSLYTQKYPPSALLPEDRWKIAFAHSWREQWSHIASHSPRMVQADAFDPILKEAKEFGIQWETVRLIGIEVLLPVSWEYGRFKIKMDPLPDQNSTNPRSLHLDRKLTYRFELDRSTYGKAFMIGYSPEDSEKLFIQGILGNGSGQEDILIRLSNQYPERLYYFCPDENGAGAPILVHDFDSTQKPNQRTDLLLTFAFGQPQRAYQIIIRDVISTPRGELFCERPEWRGEVSLPRGLSFE